MENTQKSMEQTALELTLDNLDTCIYINEIDTGNILFINKKMAKEFGDGKAFIGKPCYKVLQNGFNEMCEFCPIPKLKETGEPYCVWEEHNTVTGRYYQNTDSLIQWTDGKTVHMQHSVDITDRKMFEMKISDMVNRLEAVLTNYPGIIICIDRDKVCTTAAGTKLEKIGLGKEDLIGRNIYDTMPKYKELMDKSVGPAFNGTPSNWIMKIGDGDYNCFSSPIFNEKGKIIGALFAANDISETVKTQDELRKAMDLANQGSKAKSDFLSRMSHEIRTPMNAIIGMTKIAQETEEMEKIRYCLDNIDLSSHHLLSLINDVLDLSKIEANKMDIENERFSVEKTLMDTSNIISEKVAAKKQKLGIFIDPKMKKFFIGDAFRISQVLINLISNAIKFTPENGSIDIAVKEVKVENGQTVLEFSVKDSGIGITKEQQAKLFTSFEQGDGTTARKYGGTGLGLVISKSIVEKMGGRIWIESEPGHGAAFKFEINLSNTNEQGDIVFSGKQLENLKILVVDDSKEICDYFLKILEKFNIKADAAMSGQDAVAMATGAYSRGKPYSIIFLDWIMPEMDGIETARQIHLQTKSSVPIIMTSTAEWSEIEEIAKNVGIYKFLPKPLFPSTILNLIAETIGGIVKNNEEKQVQDISSYDFSNVNVLLVEDIKVNQEVFKALMEKTKINVDTADTGMEAIMKFRGNPDKYDIIFMDIQMPEMDGFEATRAIRALDEIESAASIPIVAMTANVFKEDIDRSLESGMNGHLGKPIEREKVIESIKLYAEKKLKKDNK